MSNKTKPDDPINDASYDSVQTLTAGLTKREYFAAKAMQGLLADHNNTVAAGHMNSTIEDLSVVYGNKLIEALNEGN